MAATKASTKLHTEITSCSSAVHECCHLCTCHLYLKRPTTMHNFYLLVAAWLVCHCKLPCVLRLELSLLFMLMLHSGISPFLSLCLNDTCGRRCLIHIKCAHFKFTVSGHKQTCTHSFTLQSC